MCLTSQTKSKDLYYTAPARIAVPKIDTQNKVLEIAWIKQLLNNLDSNWAKAAAKSL